MEFTPFSTLTAVMQKEGDHQIINLPSDWLQGRTAYGGLIAGNCLHLQRKRNDRKQRTDRSPVDGSQKA